MATIGELANVPQPGAGVASLWGQDVSNRVQHRFSSKSALDGWTTSIGGTLAVTVNDYVQYIAVTGGWARVTPWSYSVAGLAQTWIADR